MEEDLVDLNVIDCDDLNVKDLEKMILSRVNNDWIKKVIYYLDVEAVLCMFYIYEEKVNFGIVN